MLQAIEREHDGRIARPGPQRVQRLPLSLPAAVAQLAPREREIATIVHDRMEACAEEVRAAAGYTISNSAVRTILARLVAKGVIRKRKLGRRFVYLPAQPCDRVREAALQRLAQDYFDGSALDTAMALLGFLDRLEPGMMRRIGRYLLATDRVAELRPQS